VKPPNEPNGHGHEEDGHAGPAIALDDKGQARVGPQRAGADIHILATEVCESLGRLLAANLTPVAVEVVAQGPRCLGLVMLRECSADGTRFRSGTCLHDSGPDAVVGAILSATGAHRGVLTEMADRWAEHPDVHAVMVIQGAEVTTRTGPPEEGDRQWRLVRSLPAAGCLAVATGEAEHRVLRLPAAALVLTAPHGASVLKDVDGWMSAVEEQGNG
jgi:hypothetical protein